MRLCGIILLLGIAIPAVALAEEAREGSASVTLYWTTPGDDGRWGTARRYDLRYSPAMITDSNFQQATQVHFVPAPGLGGSLTHVTVTGLVRDTGYYFALKTADEKNNWSRISNVVFWDGRTVGVGAPRPAAQMSQPRPNPARGVTRFSLTLTDGEDVRIELFDVGGRRVRVLAAGYEDPGIKEYSWNFRDDVGRRLGPGVYIMHARAGEETFTRRLVNVE